MDKEVDIGNFAPNVSQPGFIVNRPFHKLRLVNKLHQVTFVEIFPVLGGVDVNPCHANGCWGRQGRPLRLIHIAGRRGRVGSVALWRFGGFI
jgi:hypothetical protein